jgi:hypothetical protein
MSPHGAVIWVEVLATWAVVLVPLWIWRRRRRARAISITDVQLPSSPQPARPVLDEYTGDVPASGAAWAVGPALEDDDGGENR